MSHERVLTQELSTKHGLPGVTRTTGGSCGLSVTWQHNDEEVGLGLWVGRAGSSFGSIAKKAARLDPKFRLPTDLKDDNKGLRLRVWSEQPPFLLTSVVAGFTRDERERRARSLAGDILARLTSEALAKPMAQVVVAYPEYPEQARRALAEWPRIQLALDATAPLAPGFPKLMKAEDFKWEPNSNPGAGKELVVLAICPSGAGEHLEQIVSSAFPMVKGAEKAGVQFFVADAEGLTVNCPAAAMVAKPEIAWSMEWDQPDGSILAIISTKDLSVAPGQVAAHGAGLLFDPQGQLVDYAPFELTKPEELNGVQGRFGHSNQRRRVGECTYDVGFNEATAQTVRLVCASLWTDYRCHVPEQAVTALRFSVGADHKLAIQRTPQDYPGRDCSAPE